jgi:hypothetical protein
MVVLSGREDLFIDNFLLFVGPEAQEAASSAEDCLAELALWRRGFL